MSTALDTSPDGSMLIDPNAIAMLRKAETIDKRRKELASCALRLLLADTEIDRALMEEPAMQERLISLRDALNDRLGQ